MTGHRIGYKFKSERENSSCGYLHHCSLYDEPQQHQTMLCNDNPNKWKKTPNKPWDNRRRRPRDLFYSEYYFSQMHVFYCAPFWVKYIIQGVPVNFL